MVAEERLRVVRCGGSWLSGSRAVFAADGKYLLCASGDYIKVYSTTTEECLHILQGHSNLVTGIQLNPTNHLQLYSCSLDGTIKLWDFMDGILIKTFVVGFKLYAFYALASFENSVFLIIPKDGDEKSGIFQLVSVALPKIPGQEVEAKEREMVLEGISSLPKCTAFGRDDEYVASVLELHLVVCFFKMKKMYRFSLGSKFKSCTTSLFTCVACHPKEDCIATGHKDGKIRLWRNFNHRREYTFSTMHWHHDEVVDLAFSVEGTSLLSGGIESVLVQWRDGSDAKKEFLPRLGSTIQHIAVSPDGTFLCTSHSDNKIVIIHSNLKVSGMIQGLIKGSEVKTGLMVDPRTKALVLNGKPGHLQFYSLQNDKQLYNQPRNEAYWWRRNGESLHLPSSHLSTYREPDHLQGTPAHLMTTSFTLNTRINMPHEDHVTAMCFRCTDETINITPTLVTTSSDGRFKVWMLVTESDGEDQSITWTCDFVGSYHNYRATNCCFSEDGSLLAVSFDEIKPVFWKAKLFEVPPCHHQYRLLVLLEFAELRICLGRHFERSQMEHNPHSQQLVFRVEWSAQLNITVLQPDCLSENIAAISWNSECSDVFVFKPSEPRPFCIQRKVCRGRVLWAVFVPREVPECISSEKYQWLSQSQFYFLTETYELMTFSTKTPEERLTPSSKQLLHTPAHVLPSAAYLCPIFINSLLVSKTNKRTDDVPNDVEMENDNGEDESEEETDITEVHPSASDALECLGEVIPKLSKAQEKELRKLRKLDYSWASAL
ncbi:hypothetical protein JD844_023033 [Phrynosoma platyrhinos]|uniref:WD repeat-containing protein 75 second beta-propeller domain-containing protein n=1 Tax=Phrynosoma platyrhinos TaxID=52577 RepID=A0ABQ7SWE1_PHRPL|nr:hypothetical protein JD844_023033 [Phrynosoma platyrhinos]